MEALVAHYERFAWTEDIEWITRYRKVRLLGTGGQGAVYLAQRLGADGFARSVALKVFSPAAYRDEVAYQEDMAKVGKVAARVAQVQEDNVVNIHDFIELNGVRLMEMEWLDGYDLREILSPAMLQRTRDRVNYERWQYINRVILTEGPAQGRLKPGVAIAVLRDCLAGLAALHREGIVHGDLKPANVVLKRSGNAKLIDIGSAIDLPRGRAAEMWSPRLCGTPRCFWAARTRRARTWQASATSLSRCWRVSPRSLAWRLFANWSRPKQSWTGVCPNCCRPR